MNNCTNTGDQSAPRAIKDVKAGDIIVSAHWGEAKVLEVLTHIFFVSDWDNFEESGHWYTFTEAEKSGCKIKGSEEKTTIIVGGQKYKLIEE